MTMREALEKIARWEMPASGRLRTQPMSYAAAYGSMGEREAIQGIARAALTPADALEQQNFDLIDEAALAAKRMRGLEEALRDLLDAVEASNKVKARDFYHERKRARAFVPKTK